MSTLVVENLNGPTSGGNANKIIIPSGQTLDASAGTILPSAGQIIQVKHAHITSATTFSSTSYADASGFSLTITPNYTNSVILINIWSGAEYFNTSSVQGAYDHRLLRGSTQIANRSWFNYLNRAHYPADVYNTFTLQFVDTPSSTSALTYKLQGRKYGGGAGNANWIINDGNGGTATAAMTVMELAQ